MEMAQAFTRLGSKVTVVEMGKALGRADRDHAEIAIEALREEGEGGKKRRRRPRPKKD